MKCLPVLMGFLALVAPLPASSQDFPQRVITMVVPVGPGGSTDFVARLVADPLGKALGQQVIVDNKPGASGNIATAQVARAKPDGYTLIMQYSGFYAVNPYLFEKLNWQPKDFAPVAMTLVAPHVIAVRADLKASSLKELAEMVRTNPDKVTYASTGSGSIQHVASELFAQQAGGKMVHVPYKGLGPAITDMLGGQVDVLNTTPPSVIGHVRGGKLRAVAYTGPKRHPALPEVPTSTEAGMPGYEVSSWFAIFAPAATPAPIVERLSSEIRKIVESAEFKRRVEEQGAFAVYMSPSELATYVKKELDDWGKVIRTANIKAE